MLVDFRVLENLSPRRNGFALESPLTFYFIFFFLNRENEVRTKNPSLTKVRKKRSTKLDFWIRGSFYPLGRYLVRGSTPLGPKLGLY